MAESIVNGDIAASESLDLVSRELSNTLDSARAEIEDYVDGQSDTEALLRAASMLHLAAGALKIVEIHGAAMLAEEMELACRGLADSDDHELIDRGVEALTRAMVQLPAYLERLLAGGGDVALLLLPLLNDLREIRKQPLLSEGTLLLLHTGPLERRRDSAAVAAGEADDYGQTLARLGQSLRPTFQSALLGWIRGSDSETNLGRLVEVCDRLAEAAKAPAAKDLWSVASGVLTALKRGALDGSVPLKRLLGQVDRQLKRLIDTGETEFSRSPPAELMNSLLYYVAKAKTEDSRITALREQFDLANFIPDDADIERAREDLSGPSVKLMQTVARAIAEDLATVKDALDIFVRTGMTDAEQLAPQMDMLRKIGDTLSVLGLEEARTQIQREAEALEAAIASGRFEDAGMLERVAASLLDVEDTLGRELIRAVTPDYQEKPEDQPEASDEESTHFRHVTEAVIGECVVNLARIKDAIVRIVDDPTEVRVLDQIGPQVKGITAGLLMLDRPRAVRIVERIGTFIASQLGTGRAPLKQHHLERLADAIVSVEYYLETLRVGRSDPWYMLDNAERCMALLERLGEHAETAAAPEPPAGAEVSPESEAAPGQPLAPAETAAPDAAQRADVQPRTPAALSVMELEEERSEPELVEVFIEEAKEEIANIKRQLPVWIENQEQVDALIAVRRSYHTLKGSGRTVGAQLMGEFAWRIEDLLNRVINHTLSPTPAMLDFIGEASRALSELLEQLEIGTPPKADIDRLMLRANAFADGDPDGAPAAAVAKSSIPLVDPVLAEIFAREVRAHQQAFDAWLDEARAAAAAPPIDEQLYRASHTLLGSARMASVAGAMTLAKPLEKLLAGWRHRATSPDRATVDLIDRAAREIERLAAALDAGIEFEADPAVLAAIDRAAAAVAATETSAWGIAEEPAEARAQEPFDPEIAAIFAEEATELLDEAETVFQGLGAGHGDASAALRELQRLLHTIKGGARMAGVAAMGDLSHALESLLAGMAEGRVDFSAAASELVQHSLDRLQHMRDALDAGQRIEPARELVGRAEAYARGAAAATRPAAPIERAEPLVEEPPLGAPIGEESVAAAGGPPESEREPEPEAAAMAGTEPAAAEPESSQGAASGAEVAAAAAEAAAASAGAEATGTRESPAVPNAASAAPSRPAARTTDKIETARVNAELLDMLLNNAGEISIYQSRLAQQLQSIEFHLSELGETVTRLREQLRNLEAETEAQILHRHQDEEGRDADFDPLELDRYSTIQQLSRALAETSNDVASINELLSGLTSETDTLLTQQNRVAAEIQNGLMQTRMVTVNRQVPRLARIVRQAAAETRKRAELRVEGADSQLDRQVLESIMPALEHLLRNAVVHGIESPADRSRAEKAEDGTVTLRVRRDGAEVIIDLSDDGAGLDLDAIRRRAVELGLVDAEQSLSDDEAVDLILRPGFSTADELTQSAGRGVGMDVVDNEVKKLGGSIRVETERGQGTRFVIRLPFTLAITHALIVTVGDETFALPLPTVEGVTRMRREQLLEILKQDDPVLSYGEVNYRVQHLGSLVGAAPSALPEEDAAVALVLVRAGEGSAALLTDSLEGSREVVVKSLGPHLASVQGVSGATILGDGRVAIILDAPTLVRSHDGRLGTAPAEPVERQLAALVVDDSITMRRVTQRLLERRGMRVLTARDGLDAIGVLQEHDVDVIVLDIEMPRMDGYQFATHVRNDRRLKDTPIVMVTSRSGEKHRAKAIEVGVNDYLSKPYQEAQLVGAIESLLGRKL